jgi:hypothetical protein
MSNNSNKSFIKEKFPALPWGFFFLIGEDGGSPW